MIQASFGLLLALHFPQRRLDEDMEHSFTTRSALVNIRRSALLSSVGFRKLVTSRSPQSFWYIKICDSSALRSSISDLFVFWWEVLSHFFYHSSIDSNLFKQRRCHCLRLKDVLMFQASSYSAAKRTFQWMLLNKILWMAPDHQAVYLGDNYTLSLPYWIHAQYIIAILIFHTWGEWSILLFIIPLLCHFTI